MPRTSSEDNDTSIFRYPHGDAPRLDATDELAVLGTELAGVGLSAFMASPAATAQPVSSAGLACPFFANDPSTHRRCLRSNLSRIVDVKRHIWAYHKRPHDCPICGSVFDTRSELDRHIRADLCVEAPPDPWIAVNSVTTEQLSELARQTTVGGSTDDQWFLIWAVVFPGADWASIGPELSNDVEIVGEVQRLRDFWSTQGKQIAEEFLTRKRIPRARWRSLKRLRVVALDCMIDVRVAEV
ncbi:hypothetical protein QBC34DRAFT_112933 [Podospora aff. communis PSN243]|uniref:C2H2-type domain-containing protein n=1 Tax=Podospora aff. communis PSN243 TaxID=3040156 RepID=A0AAV9GJG3_9PEZI|nr:hypothetical protein QBC34DRAFT_112933 [Podospora aff. communis PSN243]